MIKRKKIKVLCISDYYLPGFKGGGPIRTIANMCELLGEEIDFWIFTRDRDRDSAHGYPSVPVDQWRDMGTSKVYYAKPDEFGYAGLSNIMKLQNFDLIYLNSFFSFSGSISICIHAFWGKFKAFPILIAPRGEFSPGALVLKKFKKQAYINLARFFGVYKNIYFHASTQLEALDIENVFPGSGHRTFTASDLVSICGNIYLDSVPQKESGSLRSVFISRITPKKNLDGLLNILAEVKCKVHLAVYGPKEDQAYWDICQSLIENLPENIRVEYEGELLPSEVVKTFAAYELFLFPTHGENFGHVIFESLIVGTPVLLSDQTPWEQDTLGAVTVIPFLNTDAWCAQIESFANLSPQGYQVRREITLGYAKRYLSSSTSVGDNLAMFRAIADIDKLPHQLD